MLSVAGGIVSWVGVGARVGAELPADGVGGRVPSLAGFKVGDNDPPI